jgi:hypothetical protein
MRRDHRFFEAAAERARRTLSGFIKRQRAGEPVGCMPRAAQPLAA